MWWSSRTARLCSAPAISAAAGGGQAVVSIARNVEGIHACALTTTGGVQCWGGNGSGQLGDGSTTSSGSPVNVSGLGSRVVAIALGNFHSCALTAAGGVKCWGNNDFGQLGDGSITPSPTPVDVSGLTSGVVAIAGGEFYSCALTLGGGVKCWGDNIFGQLGNGTNNNASVAVDVIGLNSRVDAIFSGGDRTCAIIAATGGAKCWGNNVNGGIGDNSTTDRSVPTDVTNLTAGVAMLSVGNEHTCAVTTAGAAFCWGDNSQGQLGEGTTTGSLVPVPVSTLGSGVRSITAGFAHTCAVTTSGGAKCWGDNSSGEIGDGTTDNRLEPVNVPGLANDVKTIVAGNSTTYAMTTGAGAKSWGFNGNGELGDGTTNSRSTPGDVPSLSAGRATASLVTSALASGAHAITGGYVGDFNRTGSTSAALNHTVNRAPNVITFPPMPNRVLGTAPPVPAATASSGLPVIYATTTPAVCTTTLPGAITMLKVGTCSITAFQGGNAGFVAATPVPRAFSVTPGATTTTVISSRNPSTFGQSVSFTARV